MDAAQAFYETHDVRVRFARRTQCDAMRLKRTLNTPCFSASASSFVYSLQRVQSM